MDREMKVGHIASFYYTQCIEELFLFVRGKHYYNQGRRNNRSSGN